jgi:hypothetical protein
MDCDGNTCATNLRFVHRRQPLKKSAGLTPPASKSVGAPPSDSPGNRSVLSEAYAASFGAVASRYPIAKELSSRDFTRADS